ncbi:MAG TPA: inorganic phosphate transporter, partial [Pseudonocardia sp.]|nr:inorganic phosphate transporter [Pseudonocardia sp.]
MSSCSRWWSAGSTKASRCPGGWCCCRRGRSRRAQRSAASASCGPSGRRIIDLDPPRGFAAEVSASALLFVTAFGFAAPISTTQTITASILGVGTTRRLSAVRWTVAGD